MFEQYLNSTVAIVDKALQSNQDTRMNKPSGQAGQYHQLPEQREEYICIFFCVRVYTYADTQSFFPHIMEL